ncbi:MAG: transcription elongation factor GreA [Gammaproteobacteria bacterium]|nr:transcription elongation factor GreA [Gammaproteobacteria bacterium]
MTTTHREPMTINGAEKLRKELETLKLVERPRVIESLAEARSHGDLKENAEYHAAREQQSFLEGRIKDIEAKLSQAHIIDVTKIPNHGRVIFGATLDLMNLDSDEMVRYQIVGHDEADIKASKISVKSPIARALIGKKEGDVVDVQTPGGVTQYEIVKVEYL